MSVGRLDFNSEGLLLVTNDNTLKRLLENPVANLTRVYRVKVHGRVTP
jgi:23S rRNA pseudouridine2605 synthase